MAISPKVKKILAVAAVGILLILTIVFLIGRISKITPSPTPLLPPSPTPSPTPTPYPIAQGRQEYNVNLSAKSGPRIGKVTIDPLDAKMKEAQSIEVIAKSTSTVSGVLVALRTDKNVLTNHKLSLASGTATDGVWSGSWTNEVIHDYLYQVIVTATDAVTSNSTTITIR